MESLQIHLSPSLSTDSFCNGVDPAKFFRVSRSTSWYALSTTTLVHTDPGANLPNNTRRGVRGLPDNVVLATDQLARTSKKPLALFVCHWDAKHLRHSTG